MTAKAGTLLEAVARTRDHRNTTAALNDKAEQEFRAAIRKAHRAHSWAEIARVAGLPDATVRYLARTDEERAAWNGWNTRRRSVKL